MRRFKTNTQPIDQAWLDQLKEQFIDPLDKLGFGIKAYSDQFDEPTSTGVHILIFEHDGNKDCTLNQIKELMTDDDSQPMSSYTYFAGTLWIYIPYCG